MSGTTFAEEPRHVLWILGDDLVYEGRELRLLREVRDDLEMPSDLPPRGDPTSRLTTLLQKRVRELVRGQKPLFETRERNFIRIALEEMQRGLIELAPEEESTPPQLP